jgi:energy-coupling factor transport system permease protein
MPDSLSLFLARESRVHRLHPLTKISIVGFLLVGGLVLPGTWTPYALFGLVLLPLGAWGRVLKALFNATWRVTLPFAVSVFLVQGFLWPHGTPLIGLGPISLKREGLFFAIASTGRILVVVGTFLWFAFTTRPDVLMIALAQRGLPASLAYLVVSTIQIAPRYRARAVLPLVVPLILSSLLDVEERAIAIEGRAFNRPGPKTSLVVIEESGWENPARWGLLAGSLGLVFLRLWIR